LFVDAADRLWVLKVNSRLNSVQGSAEGQNLTRKKRLTRVEKSDQTRKALIKAAASVVGEVGYERASVSQITTRAKVAQGTYYSYFETRQTLLDQLLPDLGKQMLQYISERIHGSKSLVEFEERSFRAFFAYLAENPDFYRILNEAETLAPKAHEAHFKNIVRQYVQALRRSVKRGELPRYSHEELEVIVYILLAARRYLAMRYAFRKNKVHPIPEEVVRTYVKFVSGAFGTKVKD
jgi:AcrR family transcriptional regulator